MPFLKQCEFFLLRYVPNVVRGEPVNVGVVLLEEGESGFTDVRFTRDWRRVRCADPDADIELLESYEEDLRLILQSRLPEVINYHPAMSRRDWLMALMQQSLSGSLEVTFLKAVLTEAPSAELGVLAQAYLESAVRGRRVQSGRRVVYRGMRGEFEAAGVWPFMRHNISLAPYTRPGDPLKIDCGYQFNEVTHLFQATSLATDVNSATLLAYTYADVRERWQISEHSQNHLTVITEDALDVHNETIAFALQTLEESHIVVARMAAMPQIAERARLELKL